jgi:hypothetical protein
METTEPTPQQVLDLGLPRNDAGASTVRGYLVELLAELWRKEQMFSGKRPFGNSCWQYDVYGPMVRAGWVPGSFDEDGYLDECDTQVADRLILAAIQAMSKPSNP